MEKESYFEVQSDLERVPLRDHLLHGYEEKSDFYDAVRQLRDRWQHRIGECVGERNGFRQLRFHDTPGGMPDEAWLPDYLLKEVDKPDYLCDDDEDVIDEKEQELEDELGFD